MIKANEFVKIAIEIEKVPSLYGWGKFLNEKKGNYILADCSGLIKGILWGYPGKGKYGSNGVPDMNANTMISKCSKVSTNFNKLPVGALVWMNDHIGIHVGNGICIESSPIWEDGIQCTYIKGSGYSNTKKLKERKWVKQGLFDKYIDYSEISKPIQSDSYYIKYKGSSYHIDTVLKDIGVSQKDRGSWSKRKKLATKNNISFYVGTSGQNKKLIDLAKSGKLKKV